jgi:hypothetical protein
MSAAKEVVNVSAPMSTAASRWGWSRVFIMERGVFLKD